MAAMREIIYRGYSIRFHLRSNWSAQIRRPGGFMVIRDGFIAASVEEGVEVLLARCRVRIDKEEDGSPNAAK